MYFRRKTSAGQPQTLALEGELALLEGDHETASRKFMEALDTDPQRKQRILTRTPMGRLGEPDDVGWAAVYLCLEQAKFVTGQQLVVDGGASIGF